MENPVEIQASLKYCAFETREICRGGCPDLRLVPDDDDGTFALAVAEAVFEHASKNREQWRQELENE